MAKGPRAFGLLLHFDIIKEGKKNKTHQTEKKNQHNKVSCSSKIHQLKIEATF